MSDITGKLIRTESGPAWLNDGIVGAYFLTCVEETHLEVRQQHKKKGVALGATARLHRKCVEKKLRSKNFRSRGFTS